MAVPADTKIENGIAHVVLNHPPVNAFDSVGWNDLAVHIRALGDDDAVNVVVLSAEGRGFCAGVDIKELAENVFNKACILYLSLSTNRNFSFSLVNRTRKLPVPVTGKWT